MAFRLPREGHFKSFRPRPTSVHAPFSHAGTAGTGACKARLPSASGTAHPFSNPFPRTVRIAAVSVRRQQTPSPKQGKGVGKWLSLNLYPPFPSMNLQKQQLLLRLFRYFKSRKGEPRFFNKRNICLLAAAGAYILTPDEFLFDGIAGWAFWMTRRSSWAPSSPSFSRTGTRGPYPPPRLGRN